MAKADRCQVCGRAPLPHDSLIMGVHPDCAEHLEVKETQVLAIRDRRHPKKVWYCSGGEIFVTTDGED